MNLSCAKCRVVRPFSGDPLSCEVCGWVCEPIDPNQATDTEYWQHLRKLRQTPLADTGISSFSTEPNKSVNISCADCNAIRPFAGGPPNWKCEVCGWELGTSGRKSTGRRGDPEARPDSKQSSIREKIGAAAEVLAAAVGIGLVALLGCYGAWYFLQPEADRIADQYHVAADKVVIDPTPHGCDYNDAPLGEKHCHFEKDLNVVRECEQPNCKVRAVYVSWRKVSE